jgi:hypothetical protein
MCQKRYLTIWSCSEYAFGKQLCIFFSLIFCSTKSAQIYNGNMEYYHMRKRGCFELESIENLKEKLDELLAVIFKHRPVRKRDSDLFNASYLKLHFTLLNNEMLSECLSSLNLQAKKESISKRWRKDLVLELVQRSQITPLDESSTESVPAIE